MLHQNYLPGDEKMDHIHFLRKFENTFKIGQQQNGFHINYETLDFHYDLKMLNNRKMGHTSLYDYISFEGFINKKEILVVFLKFENKENYKKWRSKKEKKSQIKKIYMLDNGKIQVNIEVGSLFIHEIMYFDRDKQIGLGQAKQLDLT